MAPLPPQGTARMKITYANSINEHTVLLRGASADSFPAMEAEFQAMMAIYGTFFAESTIQTVDVAADESIIFLPYTESILIGDEFGGGAATEQTDATQASLIGRTSGGRRAKISFFGYNQPIDNFRIDTGEAAEIASLIALLNDEDSVYRAIDSLKPVWYGYIDVKPNDYWVRKARQ